MDILRTTKETIRRSCIKPLKKRWAYTQAGRGGGDVHSNMSSRYSTRIALYVITLVLCCVTLWSSLPGRGDEVTLVLNSNNDMVKAVYKCAYENPDGSVDLVFNIPKGGEELLHLQNNGSDAFESHLRREEEEEEGIREFRHEERNSEVVEETNGRTGINDTRHGIKTSYPLSLDAKYTINCVNICPVGEQVDYLIIVHSATAYFDRRRAIRETYGGRKLFGHLVQRVVFLLGLTSDPTTTKKLQEEALAYKDIVQGPFIDTYHNLTHKGVLGYRWISEHCPQAKLVVKIDDDVFVNPFKLVKEILPSMKNKTRQIACHVRPKGTSPIVRGKGRWVVKEDEFKGHTHFPIDYCNGFFVVITSDLIRPMLNAARFNPFFWIDDVYLFGILPATVGHTTFTNLKKQLTLRFADGKNCFTTKGTKCHLLAVSQWLASESEKLWYTLLSSMTESEKKELHLFGLS